MTYADIEARRKATGLSRAEMCRRAGISDTTVQKGLREARKPTGVIIRALQRVLDAEQERVA